MMITSLTFMMKDMIKYIPTSFIFFKQRLDALEHQILLTEWTHNMDTDVYTKQSEKEGVSKPSTNK